jgi:hypothetical protein
MAPRCPPSRHGDFPSKHTAGGRLLAEITQAHHATPRQVALAFRATLGVVLYAIAGVAGWLSTPKIALLIFLALPVFYGVTSEGLTETRIFVPS